MDIFIVCFSWVSFILISFCNCAKFDLQPNDLKVVEGNDAFFVCFVSELKTGQYVSWMKDTTKISKGEVLQLSGNDYVVLVTYGVIQHYTLQLRSVDREDGLFSYSCNVYYSNGTLDTKSDAAKLVVLEIPADYYPHCEVRPGSNYRDGSEVSATCKTERTQPTVSLRWLKNGQLVDSELSTSLDMVIIDHTFIAKKENNGDVFTCVMNSTLISIHRECTTSPLVFNYIPVVNIHGTPKMEENMNSIFICTSDAMPAVTQYVWSFSQGVDSSRYNNDETSQILTITRPGEDLDGMVITCTVRNSVGESSDEITIVSMDTINEGGVLESPSTPIYSVNRNSSEHIKTVLLDPPRAASNSSSDNWHDSIETVAIIAGLALVVFLLLALLPIVCIKYYRKSSNGYNQTSAESETYMFSDPRVRPQPIPLPMHIEEEPPQWTRSIGTQVTEDEVETPTDPIYIEIPPDRYIYSSSSL